MRVMLSCMTRQLSIFCTEQELSSCWDGLPFGHNRHGPKVGRGCCRGLGRHWVLPHLTQCGLGRGLPIYQVASWSIQPFGHNCRNATLLRVGIRLRTIFMVALWNRADHYIFVLFLYSFFFFSSRDWMSTILPHMVWPQCEFRMQVWNVLHAARWKYRTQKWCKKSPSGHHPTTLSGYIFATKACIDNRKKTC